jgi:hypothetical protein
MDETTTTRRRVPARGVDGQEAGQTAALPSPAQVHKDNETARLGREDRQLRSELTKVLNEVRRLEKLGRTAALSAEDAQKLRELRSEETRLHKELSSGTQELRQVRESEV